MSDADEPISIVRGLTITPAGEVTAEAAIEDALCDLAVALQGPDELPVDIEHVIAALVFASRKGEIAADYELRPGDRALQKVLGPHIRDIFRRFGGVVCEEE